MNKKEYFNEIPLTEKYRPSKLSECVLPLRISKRLEKWKLKQPNHLIFYGNAGVGNGSQPAPKVPPPSEAEICGICVCLAFTCA